MRSTSLPFHVTPIFAARLRARAGSRSQTPTTSASGVSRQPSAWYGAIHPHPTIPMRNFTDRKSYSTIQHSSKAVEFLQMSEQKLQRKLYISRSIGLCADDPGGSRSDYRTRQSEFGPVEAVKGLEAELQNHPLAKWDVLKQREIHVRGCRAPQVRKNACCVSERERRRQRICG